MKITTLIFYGIQFNVVHSLLLKVLHQNMCHWIYYSYSGTLQGIVTSTHTILKQKMVPFPHRTFDESTSFSHSWIHVW